MNKPSPSPTRTALRRLILVIAVVVGFVIFAYGFKITDINLQETQDPVRQGSLQRAMRELLSPDIFDQDTTTQEASGTFQKECSGQPVEQPAHEEGQPYVQLSPDCGTRNDVVTVEGFNFPANATGRVFLIRPTGDRQPFDLVSDPGNNVFSFDSTGHFSAQISIPNLRGDAGTLHQVEVEALIPTGLPYFSDTTKTVIEKMVETIFLALMATVIALPIAAFVSFLAARNLMKDIRIQLGSILIGFVLLPVGWFIGTLLLGEVGKLGLNLSHNILLGTSGSVALLVGFATVSRSANRIALQPKSMETHLRSIITTIVVIIAATFVLGVIGGIFLWLGARLTEGIPGYIGNMLGVIGTLIQITIVPLAGLVTALYLSSLGMSLTVPVLKGIRGLPSHLAAGVFGAVCGALLMAGVGAIGSLAAFLSVLAPLVAAIMGGATLARLYEWRFEPQRRVNRSASSQLIFFLGAAVIFVLTGHLLNVMQLIVIGRLPPPDFITISAVIGAILGAAGGLTAGMHATFPIGDVVYNVTRTILNTLRSIEPLIMGIVFVIWVSIGPFAGVLALTLHSIASLGKLYSEQIESIDLGPLEAINSTGATRLQTIIYAVVPQIIPPYIAFTMYRWDINVRMSTIIGFVGGGGIGFLLQQQINLLRYDQAGVAVLAIAIVVSILDYASASLRERVI